MTNRKNDATRQSFRPIVGIDLGTTNSAVAYIHNSKPEIIPSPQSKHIIPSVVLLDPEGKVVVGEDARAALIAMPDRTVAAVKRKIGSQEPIAIGGQALLPQEISALILKELKSYVDDRFGEGEKEAVITVPAYFTDEQRRATKQAGELAGFVVERIINEPTAAALAFGLAHMEEDRHILIYDLGGGTFDVSVVEMMSGVLEVKASSGNSHLGGEDFDWQIVDWLAEQMIAEHGVDPRGDLRARALLKEEAEKIKIKLSTEETTSVALPVVMVQDNCPMGLQLEFTRSQFISLIDSYLQETMACVQRVLTDADLGPQDIDEILLVGGSTRIPQVHQLIHQFFKKEPRRDVHPDEAVALGAAVQAGLKSGALSDSGMVATDVAPFSMGIAVLKEWKGVAMRPGGFHAIIPRNTTVPVTRTEQFYTTADGQTSASIEIYQGEHGWVKNNHRLGEFLLDGIPANGAGKEAVEVTYRYNLNGILEVTARCVSTGKEMTVTVQDALERHSQEAFQESADRLEKLFAGAPDENLAEEQFEEAWELFDDQEDDGAADYEELSEGVLQQEAASLRYRVEKLLESLTGADQSRAEEMLHRLDEAIATNDLEELRSVLDEVTDVLIDLEI
ncbi:Heat shock protein 70 [Desulforamulus reducens MI-1]|uniref:Chaperone protein DnaK n=1 Tax=Desulforamulus reducens (strain ATCC BAA-1160 / DSM 100696 / MI-1) TaxID=349161 RepID=A4J964_DESRM|nr:Hsp70 family protein [Desulforamulus reducens]ABO51617.1 Heat shock protein 70 [Desulforamulus reducens MI-1]